jgi:two-component system cell cycle sensor histidine kinase/response regulator CckA
MNIKQNANRAAGLVRQLLAFSRRQTLRPTVIDLDEALSDVSVLLARLLGETIELEVTHGRDVWPVKADLNQLEQVIVNLAVNARDAMPDGGKLRIRTANVSTAESAKFKEQGFKPGEYVLLEVADTGTGMPPQVKEKIFEPFFSTKEVGKGTGLGLSTVYGIVKQTGGFIYVDSKAGAGSTFRILLPRHEVQAGEQAEEGAAQPAGPSDLTGSARILLVEDEEAVRAFAARALEARGYTIYQASSGEDALKVMAGLEQPVDLVISDVVMPGMDGPTLLRELRRRQPDLKIIFVSGYAEDAFERHLPKDEKSFQFLPKPFSLKELATTVKATLEA